MAKFHINDNGEAGQCKAERGGCPFGDESEHYADASAARNAYEERMAGEAHSVLSLGKLSTLRALSPAEERVFDEFEDTIDPESVEFLDHSGLADDDWVTLAELAERPELLANNCFAASSELAEQFYTPENEARIISLRYADDHSHHAVSLLNEDGEQIILDYTAAQYDSKLPVPFVADHAYWRQVIEERVLRKHDTTVAEEAYDGVFTQ